MNLSLMSRKCAHSYITIEQCKPANTLEIKRASSHPKLLFPTVYDAEGLATKRLCEDRSRVWAYTCNLCAYACVDLSYTSSLSSFLLGTDKEKTRELYAHVHLARVSRGALQAHTLLYTLGYSVLDARAACLTLPSPCAFVCELRPKYTAYLLFKLRIFLLIN